MAIAQTALASKIIMSKKSASPTYMFVFRGPGDMSTMSPEEMQQSFQKWMAWIAKMKATGQYLAGDPLEDAPAKIVRGPRGATVGDGPFAEAKEVVGGYMLIKAKNFAAAVQLSKACPILARGGSVEVRQIMPFPY
jgi:hypothetical protein